jgi:hypothetical protein
MITTNLEKALDKYFYLFYQYPSKKFDADGMYLSVIQAIYEKSTSTSYA